MYCCSNCFAYPWLKNYVANHSKVTGTCEFCGSTGVSVLSTDELAEPFHNMLSLYVPADSFESGELLLNLIQWNWEVFDDSLNENEQAALLEEIANSDWDDDDGEPMLDATALYMPKSSQWSHNTHSDTWEQFCFDVRRDPQTTIPFDDFIAEELGESEEILHAGTTFCRARLGFKLDENEERVPWGGTEIGAPPPNKVTAGRANAAGQVVLYAADQEKTAVFGGSARLSGSTFQSPTSD